MQLGIINGFCSGAHGIRKPEFLPNEYSYSERIFKNLYYPYHLIYSIKLLEKKLREK